MQLIFPDQSATLAVFHDETVPFTPAPHRLNADIGTPLSSFSGSIDLLPLGESRAAVWFNRVRSDRPFSTTAKRQKINGTPKDDARLIAPGNTILKGLAGNDTLTAKKTNNVLLGGGGDDTLIANKGQGSNLLKGGGGDDELIGGGRDDLLVGGGGSDRLIIADGKFNPGLSIIKGFQGNDAIAILNIGQVNDFGDLAFQKQGKDTVIQVGKRAIALVEKTQPGALSNQPDAFVFSNEAPPAVTPIISIDDSSLTEGSSGTSALTFTVTLSQAATDTVTVDFSTEPGTAMAGSDYTPVNGILTFIPGTTSQTITVAVIGDTIDEPSETFLLNLTNPVGGAIADAQAIGTIIDNPEPVLSISDITLAEGNTNSTVTLTVTLDAPAPTPITVNYSTANGTATANSDYTATSGTLTFGANTTSQTLSIPILGDDIEESDETLVVNLSSPSGASLGTPQATVTILNDDIAPERRDQRTGKLLENPSAGPDLQFKIFDTLANGLVIGDSDPSNTVGVFEQAIEELNFTTDGFINNISSELLFAVGTLTVTRSGNFMTYLFASDAVQVTVENLDTTMVINDTLAIEAVLLTVDLTGTTIPAGFDAEKAVNDLDYIIANSPFRYATNGTAYAGAAVTDIDFGSPNLCPPGGLGTNCQDLMLEVM